MSAWQSALLHFAGLLPYPFLLPLFAALAGGEELIIAATIIAVSTGILSLPLVMLFAFLGTSFKDACVFLFGLYSISYLEKKESIRKRFHQIGRFVNKFTHRNYFLTLFVTKFLYGVRVLTIFYLGREGVTFPRFLLYNVPVTGVWICVTCGLGYLAARGLIDATQFFGDVTYGLTALVFAAIGIYAVRLWISKRFVEEEKQ